MEIDLSRIESYVAAQNFCTGSQTDYSTCIANNLTFLPFLDDTYTAADKVQVSIRNAPIPYLSGDTYVDLIPLAVSDIISRVMMTNDYGVVSFRCNTVFNKPLLPLPRLQDLGIDTLDLLNITEVNLDDVDGGTYFGDIPISTDPTLNGYMINLINYLIGYTTAFGKVVNYTNEITGIIAGMWDYRALPGLSEEMDTQILFCNDIYDELQTTIGQIKNALISYNTDYYDIMGNMVDIVDTYATIVYNINLYSDLHNNVTVPLSAINDNTDFTTFDYTITDNVVTYIAEYDFILPMETLYLAKQASGLFGRPPNVEETPSLYQALLRRVAMTYSSEILITQSSIISKIQLLYTYSNVPQVLTEVRAYDTILGYYVDFKSFYTTDLTGKFEDIDGYTDASLYEALIVDLQTSATDFSMNYSGGQIDDIVESLYIEADLDAMNLVIVELDLYFIETGNEAKIDISSLGTAINEVNGNTDDRITEVTLGGSYTDAGDFYYADIAYAVGYGKLTNLKSIQIDDEIYDVTAITDENGNVLSGISESGCTKYTFTRHVMPTYSPEVHMYIYPGTPDQPYCPTVNKYHNFASTKYSGMFTKMDGDEMGVYIYKGYRPMDASVEEVIQLGKMDINSINLNDPLLDDNTYESMLQTEIKNLTNASSINGEPLTTEDFKYYLHSEIVDDQAVTNYPGMAMVEFKAFPIGQSFQFPKIKLNVESTDPVSRSV